MAPLLDMDGVWGEPTSTLDWCEENYVVTPYIAEFWNTVSNVAMIIPPIMSMVYLSFCNVEQRFYWACFAFLSVGLGSWCFHMTLLYEMQLLDELPMIWGTCVLVYAFYESNSEPNSHNYPLALLLLIYASLVTGIYILTNQPVFHQTAYGILVFTLVFRGVYCVTVNKQEYSLFLFVYSIGLYATGFFLWLVDNGFCTQIRQSRELIPAPASAVLQLHGWWHVLAGLGTHGHIMFSCYLRNRFLKRETTVWQLGILPFVSVGKAE
ncbi:alkaline ceramidase 3-like [Acanthaster planci]|uniref:Alkaline ceramidase n=1 Tax=Acanthaster planci TaxID=133434 RepID=A0A8B7ZC68_ACAPL|nr:alkaline ceramidase 3-like [Acanthaster planci]